MKGSDWLYVLVDTSRISIFIAAIFLITYGSIRSLRIELDARKAADKQHDVIQTLDSYHAILVPVCASLSLLVMFFFFDSLQTLIVAFTAVVATISVAFLLLPVCQFLLTPCVDEPHRLHILCVGQCTVPELLSVILSVTLVCLWLLTGHWLLMNALGMGLCVAFIALVRLPSLKVSTLLLVGLLLYDVLWVFFSSYLFKSNVMIHVATHRAENPFNYVIKEFKLNQFMKEPPKLSLPAKLVFPSMLNTGRFFMLGLGDIVMPGLVLCFVLRYDTYKRSRFSDNVQETQTTLLNFRKVSYFHCSLAGYFLGLMTATICSELFHAAQPALLYLVPFTLIPLFLMAYLKDDLKKMWNEPFVALSQKFVTLKCQEV